MSQIDSVSPKSLEISRIGGEDIAMIWVCYLTLLISYAECLAVLPKVRNDVLGIDVNPVPLFKDDTTSPFTYAVSDITKLQPNNNFLATQVWPASRMAAEQLIFLQSLNKQQHNEIKSICELGCGPGLPSIAAAKLLDCNVIATDIDPLALELVNAAAYDQKLSSKIRTEIVDLTKSYLPEADIYLLSDVFETSDVATGAASLLYNNVLCSSSSAEDKKQIWVFCQSDRAQRDVFLNELKILCNDETLEWKKKSQIIENFNSMQRLVLWDVDESEVCYG